MEKQFYLKDQQSNIQTCLNISGEIIHQIEMMLEREADDSKIDDLKFLRSCIGEIYDKLENLDQTNQLLKIDSIIKNNERIENSMNYEISDYEILNVEKLECNDRKIAEIEVMFRVNNNFFIIKDYFTLNKNYEFRLVELFYSAGLLKKGVPYRMEWEKLKGRRGKCLTKKISEDNYIISKYLKPEER